ncbi:hypothetical protein [Maribacter sp. 2-571]|uniref:hypothetical protein n=1 Tax=Maribacter sp. 2-571 TaxID=3417569 RepID=UPI003D32D141
MKKIFSLFAILGIILASNCSRIPENDDPIIGYWEKVDIQTTSQTNKQKVLQKWTFNDAYLGRYNHEINAKETLRTDFKWSEDQGTYTISYPGTDLPDQKVTLQQSDKGEEILKDAQGTIVAIRN